jgi:hypothetical protein
MCLKIAVTEDQEVTVNRESIGEYVVRQWERYEKATRAEKGRILDEVVSVLTETTIGSQRYGCYLAGEGEVEEVWWADRRSTVRG